MEPIPRWRLELAAVSTLDWYSLISHKGHFTERVGFVTSLSTGSGIMLVASLTKGIFENVYTMGPEHLSSGWSILTAIPAGYDYGVAMAKGGPSNETKF